MLTPLLAYPTGSSEPVTVSEARLACRIDGSVLDSDLALSIEQARQAAEHITGRFYRRQVRRVELSGWPAERFLLLDLHQPVAVAIAIRSSAEPEDWTAVDAGVFWWSARGLQTHIQLRAAQPTWPELASEETGLRVRLDVTVGPGEDDLVPAAVRRYILATCAAWFAQPEAQRIGSGISANPLFERLLDGERLWA